MRTLADIKAAIKSKIRTFTSLDSLKFPEEGGSSVSVFNTMIDTVAASIYLSDAVWEAKKTEVQDIADSAFSGNSQWLRQQILNFQYTDIITLDSNYRPVYAVIDEAKQIVTRCAITDRPNGGINIKVAKGTGTLSALTTLELDALKDYYFGTSTQEGIGFAGVIANFISQDADRMRVGATISYVGQYDSATVKTNVIAAINDFFATFADVSFDGTVFMNRLVDAIQEVPGVSRVKLTDIRARPATTAFIDAITVDPQEFYVTTAGYLIAEDTAGNTLNDTIIMSLETL